jgi:hypothetical protein
MDPTFLKDIRVSLLSDLLTLKFKQSCADSKFQDGQIEVLDSQTPDWEILYLGTSTNQGATFNVTST